MTKLIYLKDIDNKDFDFASVNLKCGIEIHQQLDTGKLFCSCPCKIVSNEKLNKEIVRNLRFSLSETGEIDAAALDEIKKDKYNLYKYNDEIACLVDLDEEPPHKLNSEALSVAIRLGHIFHLNFVDRIQFMRKLIVDGSIISGFQRTALLGLSGYIMVGDDLDTEVSADLNNLSNRDNKGNIETKGNRDNKKRIRINSLNIEEDASRIIEKRVDYNVYALDRQGIPLVEITTGPDISSPDEVYKVANLLGNILRSFKEMKRGIGTIRQDLNISVENGARVELKGAQNLKLIPEIVRYEVFRQVILNSIREELKYRGVDYNDMDKNFIGSDVTSIFTDTASKVIISVKNKSMSDFRVSSIRLKKFGQILGHELSKDYRFATEIAKRVKLFFPEIKGLFHSDELPNYGITEREVGLVREKLRLDEDDAFILICGHKDVTKKVIFFVIETLKELMLGVNEEVRRVDPKTFHTTFLRKMPTSARMYPETDIPLIELDSEFLNLESKNVPELYNEKIKRLIESWNISKNKISELLDIFDEETITDFLAIVSDSNLLYSILVEMPKEILKREKIVFNYFEKDLFLNILNSLRDKKILKKTIYDVLIKVSSLDIKELKDIILDFDKFLEDENFLVEEIDMDNLEKEIKMIVSENKSAPFGALMGLAMKKFKNRVDGKVVSEFLNRFIEENKSK